MKSVILLVYFVGMDIIRSERAGMKKMPGHPLITCWALARGFEK